MTLNITLQQHRHKTLVILAKNKYRKFSPCSLYSEVKILSKKAHMYQLLCFENGSVLEKKKENWLIMNFLQRRVGFYLEMNITSNTNVLPVVGIPKNLYGQKGTKYWYLKTITLRVV